MNVIELDGIRWDKRSTELNCLPTNQGPPHFQLVQLGGQQFELVQPQNGINITCTYIFPYVKGYCFEKSFIHQKFRVYI